MAVAGIRDRLEALRELDKRRESILKRLEESGKLTDELKEKVLAAETLPVLEDIYLPYRPKRRTRARWPGKRASSRWPRRSSRKARSV